MTLFSFAATREGLTPLRWAGIAARSAREGEAGPLSNTSRDRNLERG
jgi:hypothetical protein